MYIYVDARIFPSNYKVHFCNGKFSQASMYILLFFHETISYPSFIGDFIGDFMGVVLGLRGFLGASWGLDKNRMFP